MHAHAANIDRAFVLDSSTISTSYCEEILLIAKEGAAAAAAAHNTCKHLIDNRHAVAERNVLAIEGPFQRVELN
jgi:hypothetical protein